MNADENWTPEIPEGLEPLSPNPGGIGEPADLVGRQMELARLHEAVKSGGAHVTGERRMGKTWLIKKLQEDLKDTVTAIYVSAETADLDIFATRLLQELRDNRLVKDKVAKWEKEVGGEVKLDTKLIGLTLTGKMKKPADTPKQLNVLDLLGSQQDGPVVLIIDEITHLCQALGQEKALEFMSGLRSSRQSGGPPLVISGSIGLHHALADLRPINDLWSVTVGPLGRTDAVTLAARLLLGIGVEPTPSLVADIVRETSAIPFYIQAVVDQFRYHPKLDVTSIINECIASDLWHTSHYDTRLSEYYGPEREHHARAVLDVVAVCEEPLDIETIRGRMVAKDSDLALTRDELLKLIDKLEKDHYLVREGNADRISSPLLAKIWRYLQRLA